MPKYTYGEAILKATEIAMQNDERVILVGEGVPDPKAVFGTTKGLKEKFPERVFDMPVSENGMTGICIGAAIQGLKPILVHMRIDFSLYAFDQIVNNAAKWHSMYGGRAGYVPMVVRCLVGRGWGQGNQHSQPLAHLYATIPGLKVVCPATARDAGAMFLKAIDDPNPVIFVEHRWLHNTVSEEDNLFHDSTIGKARIIREGSDVTIVAWSYMVHEAIHTAISLESIGIHAEVIDMRSIRPLDMDTVIESVQKTRKLVVLEEAWNFNSLSSEIITQVYESDPFVLTARPLRITLPDSYAPSTPHLTKYYYPNRAHIFDKICSSLEVDIDKYMNVRTEIMRYEFNKAHDVPDENFKGPF